MSIVLSAFVISFCLCALAHMHSPVAPISEEEKAAMDMLQALRSARGK